MNDTPTPETNAAIQRINAAHFRGAIVAPIFAAKLERERDAAREDVRCKDIQIAGLTNDLMSLRDNLNALLKEAREDADRLAKALERHAGWDQNFDKGTGKELSMSRPEPAKSALAAHTALKGDAK